jgi:hypothetical protein
MSVTPALSLDQLEVLLTVVEAGSFAAASRTLNRATSAISYAIDTLERQLGNWPARVSAATETSGSRNSLQGILA